MESFKREIDQPLFQIPETLIGVQMEGKTWSPGASFGFCKSHSNAPWRLWAWTSQPHHDQVETESTTYSLWSLHRLSTPLWF